MTKKEKQKLVDTKVPKRVAAEMLKIKNALTYDELANLSTSILGMSYLLGTHILEGFSSQEQMMGLPDNVKYALLHTYNYVKLFKNIINSKDGKEFSDHQELHVVPNVDKIDEDYHKRLVFLAACLYEELKKDIEITK